MIGERLKHVFTGYKVWILSYKDECFDKIGLRPGEKMKLMNGSLECEYRCFEMFDGKNKDFKKALNEQRGEGEERRSAVTKRNDGSKIVKKTNFKTARMDRPERRFAAAHLDDDDDSGYISNKKLTKMRYRDDDDRRKGFGNKHITKKPFKKKGRDDFED